MRIIGLDVGSKTIGVAVSDELGYCAHALRTLDRRGTRADVQTVLGLARQYGTTRLVVGLPYDCEGNEGKRAARVRVLGDALVQAGLQVDYQDESYSTVQAEEVLLEADLSRARRKQVVDRLAAAVILQAWLDAVSRAAALAQNPENQESQESQESQRLAVGEPAYRPPADAAAKEPG